MCTLGIYSLWIFVVRRKYAVLLSQDGLAYAHSRSGEAPLAWSEVSRFRFRPILQRLEMIDSRGVVRFRVEAQVQRFDELVSICGAKVTPKRVLLPRSFVRRPAHNDLVMAILIVPFFGFAIVDHANSFPLAAMGASGAVFYLASVLIFNVRRVTATTAGESD